MKTEDEDDDIEDIFIFITDEEIDAIFDKIERENE
jgi:hypothetical protein